MFICPVTGLKLRYGQAKGGTFWYSPYSHGRLLTFPMVRHYMGAPVAQHLWLRSEKHAKLSPYRCPSCTKPMQRFLESNAPEAAELDACRKCQVLWFDGGEHAGRVPGGSDIAAEVTAASRPTTVPTYEGKSIRELMTEEAQDRWVDDVGPSGRMTPVADFLDVPVLLPNKNPWKGTPWITFILSAGMVLIHVYLLRRPDLKSMLSFSPAQPFAFWGVPLFTWAFLHSNWIHLLSNLYFFWIFSDDVETNLGTAGYLEFLAVSCLIGAGAIVLIGDPHGIYLGLSGIVMAVMVFYALEFPNSRMAYLFPTHALNPLAAHNWQWLRLPVGFIAAAYIGLDVLRNFHFEQKGLSSSAHSAHIGGALAGLGWWACFGGKSEAGLLPKGARNAT